MHPKKNSGRWAAQYQGRGSSKAGLLMDQAASAETTNINLVSNTGQSVTGRSALANTSARATKFTSGSPAKG